MKKKVFTNREKEILKLKMNGLGDKEVAEKLSISYYTVRTHIERAKSKLGCSNVIQLVSLAKSRIKA